MIQTGSWTGVCCFTGTRRNFNRNSDRCRFCHYQHTTIGTIWVHVCVYIESEKERRETADERQSHNYSDGVLESTNKRQAKKLKVMCFIDSKKITLSASSWPPPNPPPATTPRGDRPTPWWCYTNFYSHNWRAKIKYQFDVLTDFSY